jgi:hypothetical protein
LATTIEWSMNEIEAASEPFPAPMKLDEFFPSRERGE